MRCWSPLAPQGSQLPNGSHTMQDGSSTAATRQAGFVSQSSTGSQPQSSMEAQRSSGVGCSELQSVSVASHGALPPLPTSVQPMSLVQNSTGTSRHQSSAAQRG